MALAGISGDYCLPKAKPTVSAKAPVAEKKPESQEIPRENSTVSQGDAPTAAPSLGNELQVVVEETSEQADNSLKMTGLDLVEQVPIGEDLQDYGMRNSFENDYAEPGDGAGDIINPMEGAQFYQGSF
jgi:hypothetical protein